MSSVPAVSHAAILSPSTQSNSHSGRRRGKAKALLLAAASVAAAALAGSAQADGTATTTLNPVTGDRNWDSAIWTWVGDTGGQVFPGDSKGDGTENAVAQVFTSGRTLNFTTTTTAITIGS